MDEFFSVLCVVSPRLLFSFSRIARSEIMIGVLEMQSRVVRLQEELKKAEEELRICGAGNRALIEKLEEEVHRAKESEKTMLESLVSQTKQLEQTKISYEEAKLEMEMLRNEVKMALQAVEGGKHAMDALALALKEVMTESNQNKTKLFETEMELRSERAKAERLGSELNQMERKLREAIFESRRLKREAEQVSTAWMEKETGFLDCMKASEDELDDLKLENERLTQSQRTARGETSKLRDIIKQAVNEATVVKEALEIAREENSQLKDSLQEMQHAMNRLKHEYECLRVSEAALTDSVQELKGLLAAASLVESKAAADSYKGRQVSWGGPLDRPEVEGSLVLDVLEGGGGDGLGWRRKDRKHGKSMSFESQLQFGDATWEWKKQRKRKQILRSLSDILRKKSSSLGNRR